MMTMLRLNAEMLRNAVGKTANSGGLPALRLSLLESNLGSAGNNELQEPQLRSPLRT